MDAVAGVAGGQKPPGKIGFGIGHLAGPLVVDGTFPDKVAHPGGDFSRGAAREVVLAGPGGGAVRQRKTLGENGLRRGAALGTARKAVGQEPRPVFQAAACEHGAGFGIVGQVQNALQGKGADGDLPALLTPAGEGLCFRGIRLPAFSGILGKALPPEVQRPVKGSGDNHNGQFRPVPAVQGGKVRAALGRGNHGGGQGGFPQPTLYTAQKGLPEGRGMVPVFRLGIESGKQQAHKPHRNYGGEDQLGTLGAADFPAAGGNQQQHHPGNPAQQRKGGGQGRGQKGAQKQAGNAQNQGKQAAPFPQKGPEGADGQGTAVDGQRKLRPVRDGPGEIQIPQVVNAVQQAAEIHGKPFALGLGLRKEADKTQAEGGKAEKHRPTVPPGQKQQGQKPGNAAQKEGQRGGRAQQIGA